MPQWPASEVRCILQNRKCVYMQMQREKTMKIIVEKGKVGAEFTR